MTSLAPRSSGNSAPLDKKESFLSNLRNDHDYTKKSVDQAHTDIPRDLLFSCRPSALVPHQTAKQGPEMHESKLTQNFMSPQTQMQNSSPTTMTASKSNKKESSPSGIINLHLRKVDTDEGHSMCKMVFDSPPPSALVSTPVVNRCSQKDESQVPTFLPLPRQNIPFTSSIDGYICACTLHSDGSTDCFPSPSHKTYHSDANQESNSSEQHNRVDANQSVVVVNETASNNSIDNYAVLPSLNKHQKLPGTKETRQEAPISLRPLFGCRNIPKFERTTKCIAPYCNKDKSNTYPEKIMLPLF